MTNQKNFSKIFIRLFMSVGILGMALLVAGAPSLASAETLSRQLEVGSSGSDVSALQSFLAQDSTIYPQGLVTGYFGFLTKAAVSNFQSQNGISSVGRVGPATLTVLNAKMSGGTNTGGDNSAPIISSVGLNTSSGSANVSWNTSEPARGLVYYSNTPLTTYENPTSVNVSGSTAFTDTTFRYSQNVSLSGLQSNTVYYYLIYSTDQVGNVSVTWPSTFRTN